jgi:hypothetical protein
VSFYHAQHRPGVEGLLFSAAASGKFLREGGKRYRKRIRSKNGFFVAESDVSFSTATFQYLLPWNAKDADAIFLQIELN